MTQKLTVDEQVKLETSNKECPNCHGSESQCDGLSPAYNKYYLSCITCGYEWSIPLKKEEKKEVENV